jgi:hypothetical protein
MPEPVFVKFLQSLQRIFGGFHIGTHGRFAPDERL